MYSVLNLDESYLLFKFANYHNSNAEIHVEIIYIQCMAQWRDNVLLRNYDRGTLMSQRLTYVPQIFR